MIDEDCNDVEPYNDDEIDQFLKIAQNYSDKVIVKYV